MSVVEDLEDVMIVFVMGLGVVEGAARNVRYATSTLTLSSFLACKMN